MSSSEDYSSFNSSVEPIAEQHVNEVFLKVMQYNVQILRYFRLDVNWWRRRSFVNDHVLALQKEYDFDVIVFNEVFIKGFYDELKESLFNSLPYTTSTLNFDEANRLEKCSRRDKSLNSGILTGGVTIFSKYPIVESYNLVFSEANGLEKLCRKGAVLAKILKCGQCFNIVGTHFQSGEKDKNHKCRMNQGKQLAEWIRSGIVSFNAASVSDELRKEVKAEDLKEGGANGKVKSIEKMETLDVFKHKSQSLNKMLNDTTGDKNKKGDAQRLPEGVLSVSDPLIFAGDFNIRYDEDYKWLMALLDPDCLNASLTFDSNTGVYPTYDSTTNDYCQFINKDKNAKYNDLIDYFFLSNKCGGSVKQSQFTINKRFDGPIQLTRFLMFIPLKSVTVHHPSDHFPIGAIFSSKK